MEGKYPINPSKFNEKRGCSTPLMDASLTVLTTKQSYYQ